VPLPLVVAIALILRVQISPLSELVALHLPLALVLLLLNLRFRLWRLFMLSVLTTFLYLFVGNMVFGNTNCATSVVQLLPHYGCAVIAALPRTVMLLYGYAWLNSGSTQSFTRTFTRLALPFGRSAGPTRYIAGSAQYFSQLAAENETLEYALKFHLTAREKGLGLVTRVQLTWLRLGAIVFKMFYAIPDFAYALESRYPRSKSTEKTVTVSEFHLTGFKAKRRAAPIDVALSPSYVSGNVIDLDEQPEAHSKAILDVLSGMVPHLRGEVSGTVTLSDGDDYLSWPQDRKFSFARYVGGTSSSRQLLGPTVQFEMESSSPHRRDIKKSLKYWGLEDLRTKRVQELSGGQRVRLALASAMVSAAKLVLLDDVEGQLDVDGRALLEKWIVSEAANGARRFVSRRARSDALASSPSNGQSATTVVNTGKAETIIVERIRLIRGGRILLNNWSHTFRAGTLTILTGPNGSGKTSLGLAIGGALELAHGSISRSKAIGMSFQAPLDQVFRFTVAEEISVRPQLAAAQEPESSSYVQEALDLIRQPAAAEIVDLSAAPLRVTSMCAMMYKTGFLILDEPSNGLSSADLEDVTKVIADLRAQGTSILVISHDPALWDADAVIELGAG